MSEIITDVCGSLENIWPVKDKEYPLCYVSGRCNPDDLMVDERLPTAPPPAQLPDPPRVKEEDSVTDIEAELLWENQPHPPQGDVPNRRPYLDYRDGESKDQAAPHSQRSSPSTGSSGSSVPRVMHRGLKVRIPPAFVSYNQAV